MKNKSVSNMSKSSGNGSAGPCTSSGDSDEANADDLFSRGFTGLSDECIDPDWTPLQRKVAHIVGAPCFDLFMGVVVTANIALMVVETNDTAACLSHPGSSACDTNVAMGVMNWLLLLVFVVELGLRYYVFGRKYFSSIWNKMDAGVVVLSIVAEVIGNSFEILKALRLLRLLRLTRVIRVLGNFRELYMMLHGMLVTLKTVFWAALLMFGLITVWAIVAVNLLYPHVLKVAAEGGYLDCERCVAALASVWDADLTLFELTVHGEGWGTFVLPLVDSKNNLWGSFVALSIVFGVYFTVVIGLMNLVLAVIVDFAVAAREEDKTIQHMEKEKRRLDAKKQLETLCGKMDADKDHKLTLSELMRSFEKSEEFRHTMDLLDIDKEDIETVFGIMDRDKSGDVSSEEFTELLYKMKSQSSRTLLLFIKHYTMEIKQNVSEELDLIRHTVAAQLYRNTTITEQIAVKLNVGDAYGEASPDADRCSSIYAANDSAPLRLDDAGQEEPGPTSCSDDLPGVVMTVDERIETIRLPPLPATETLASKASGSAADSPPRRQMLQQKQKGSKEPAFSGPELDRLERLGMQIETQLAGLRSHVLRKVDERCKEVLRVSQKASDEQEKISDVLNQMKADQNVLLAAAMDPSSPSGAVPPRPPEASGWRAVLARN